MPISKLYMLGPVILGGAQINQITEYSPDPGVETETHYSDGGVDPNFAVVMSQKPRLGFTTTALKRALDLAGISGRPIGDEDTSTAVLYFQKLAAGAARAGGSTAFSVTGTSGMLVPQTLQADDKGFATLGMQIVLASTDGETAPMAIDENDTMPAATLADQLYTVGDIKINGTLIEGVKSITVDFGLDLVIENGSGEAYPTFVGIQTRAPSISFRTTDPTVVASGFAAQGATDSLVHFRKCTRNGTRVAKATAEHIKISIDDGIISARTIGGGGTKDVQMHEVTIQPIYDGVNDILAISTAAAIA